jgi:menaquinol-cytochrome c reductase iron-sulfur subunit
MSDTLPPDAGPEEVLNRRRFLSRVSLALSGLAAAVISVPIIAYLLSPLLQPTPESWQDVGGVDDFALGKTTLVAYEEPSSLPWAGQTSKAALWLRRTGAQEFIAFGLNCSHLGCPVDWQPGADLFMCPCHGGVYYSDGTVAGGPPPHALSRFNVRIAAKQRVEVLTRPQTEAVAQT